MSAWVAWKRVGQMGVTAAVLLCAGAQAHANDPLAEFASHVEADAAAGPATCCSNPCDCADLCDGGCSNGCCGGCGSTCGGCCCGPAVGLFNGTLRGDHAFDRFISPQSNVLFFEDPRTVTEARLHYVSQDIPTQQALFQGGNVQYWALQLRVALTERLSFIATKDGYIDLHVNNPALPDTNGWADIVAGLKYNVVRNPETQTIVSLGAVFEADAGDHDVFQGEGAGETHLFVSAGQEILGRGHWLSGSGFRIPFDRVDGSQMWYWSNQWDYEVIDTVYLTYSVNWFHWLASGRRLPGVNFEGGDLINLGAGDVAGNDIVTMAWGTRWKPCGNFETGAAIEIPVTDRRDLLSDRLYVDAILRY